MSILEYVSLKPHNTFGVDVCTHYFCCVKSKADIVHIIEDELQYYKQHLIIGGGSNILLCNDFDGLVILNEIRGIDVVKEDEAHVWVEVKSGTVWHELVEYCVERNLGGIENLALIPGTAGAAPIQNIGAYGVELKDTFDTLKAIDMETAQEVVFGNADCKFGYRQSVFKTELKGKYFIYSVILKLAKHPQLQTSYGDIRTVLENRKIQQPSIRDVADAVIQIRSSKLPDPKVIGNAGSFFKNPEVDKPTADKLKSEYQEMPYYMLDDNTVKIPAAWLIEQCGWKGKQVGQTGNHTKQALVIVNYGDATGAEIWAHALKVQQSVQSRFGILLDPEVNVI
jgi:UDP-N-acetylmuramate dehydrogenase